MSIALRGLWNSHLRTFDEYMSNLRLHSKRVSKEAGLAHMIESARNREIQLRNQALQIQNSRLERRNRALTSLPTVDYLSKQTRLFNIRHPGTCDWLQGTAEYALWFTSLQSTCLCCYGIPGSGKSVLAANLRNSLLNTMAPAKNDLVSYYHFDYADHASLDSLHVVASLIKQVLEHLPLDHFDDSFSYPFGQGRSPDLAVSMRYLANILKSFGTTFMILDGVDELSAEEQTNTLKLIEMLLQQSDLIVKVFVTSRTEEFRVKKALQNHGVLYMSQNVVDADIATFIEDKIELIDAPHPLVTNPTLKFEVVQALVNGAKGM
jgi:hypothetical protein